MIGGNVPASEHAATLPWVEKYRPSSLQEIAGNAKAKKELKEWAISWAEDRPERKAVLIAGPPGTGKTSAAIGLANEMGWDYVELNASDERSEKQLMRIAAPGARSNSFSPFGDYFSVSEGRRHLIILDEADNLHAGKDRGGLSAISKIIEETKQPIILIANDLRDITRRSIVIKKQCKLIQFHPVGENDIISVLRNIAKLEHLDVDEKIIRDIATGCKGDMRAAINDLQSVASNSEGDILIFSRMSTMEPKEGLSVLFKANGIREAREAISNIDEEPGMLNLWLEANLKSYQTDRTLERSLFALAESSLLSSRAGKFSYYRLWSYAYDLIAIGYLYEKQKLQLSGEIKFPIVLTKFGPRNALRQRRMSALHKIAAYTHTSPKKVEASILPCLLAGFEHSTTFAKNMIRKLDLSVEDVSSLLGIEEDAPIIKKIFE
jgi:replication factor C large subunit